MASGVLRDSRGIKETNSKLSGAATLPYITESTGVEHLALLGIYLTNPLQVLMPI